MAEKDIKRSIPKDLFDPIGDSAEKNKARLETLIAELNILVEVAKKIKGEIPKAFPKGGGVDPKAAKSVEELTKLQIKANQVAKNKLAIDEEIRKERILLQEQNKKANQALRDQIALENKQIGTLERVRVESRKLRREREQLDLSTEKGRVRLKQINSQLDKNNEIIKENSDLLKKQKLNVGNYEGAIKNARNSLLRFTAAVTAGVASLRGLFISVNEQDQINKRLTASFDLTGESLDKVSKKVEFLSKAYGAEINDVLQTANVLTNEFGINSEKAFNLVEEGFQKGANVRGEFLEQLKEYSTQFVNVGLSAEEAIAVITQQEQKGVFSDKGVDAIKEAGIRLTELPKATEKALNAIGLSGSEIQEQITSGQKTVFEVTQEISREIAKLPANSKEVGQVLADVFGGAGEDAKGFVLELGNVSTSLDELEDNTTEFEKAQQEIIRQFVEVKQEISNALIPAFTFLAKNFTTILGLATKLGAAFVVYRTRLIALNVVQKAFGNESGKINISLKQFAKNLRSGEKGLGKLGSALKGVGWTAAIFAVQKYISAIRDAINGNVQLERALKKVNKQIGRSTERAEKNVETRRKDLKEQQKQAKTEEERIKIAKKFQELTKQDIETVEKRKAGYEENLKQLKKLRDSTKGFGTDLLEFNKDAAEALGLGSFGQVGDFKDIRQAISQMEANIEGANAAIAIYSDELESSQDDVSFLTDSLKDSKTAFSGQAESADKAARSYKDASEQLEILNKRIETQNQIEDEANEFAKSQREREFNEALKQEEEKTRRTGDINFDGLKLRLKQDKEFRDKQIEQAEISAIEQAETQEEVILATQRADQKRIESQQIYEDSIKSSLDTLEMAQEDYANTVKERNDKIAEEEKEALAKRLENQKKYIALSEQLFTKNLDARIEKLDEETKASEKSISDIEKAAQQGSDTAEQSLAVENQKIAQANAEKERLERRKQQVLLVSSILQSYNSNLSAGDESGEALAKAITGTEVLSQFISALPAFMEGTEDTGTNGRGVDGKGGFHAILHENEGVIKKETNVKKLNAGLTNESAVDYAIKYKDLINSDFKQFDYDKQIHVGLDNHLVVNEMMKVGEKIDDLTKVIKSQPVYDGTEIRDVHSKMYELVRTIKKGNKKFTDINRFNA